MDSCSEEEEGGRRDGGEGALYIPICLTLPGWKARPRWHHLETVWKRLVQGKKASEALKNQLHSGCFYIHWRGGGGGGVRDNCGIWSARVGAEHYVTTEKTIPVSAAHKTPGLLNCGLLKLVNVEYKSASTCRQLAS